MIKCPYCVAERTSGNPKNSKTQKENARRNPCVLILFNNRILHHFIMKTGSDVHALGEKRHGDKELFARFAFKNGVLSLNA